MSSKREKVQAFRLEAFEMEFRELLIPCLQQCARGRWGLFGAYERFPEAKYWMNWPDVDRLRELAISIRAIRAEFGEESELCEEFLKRCQFHRPNDPGEPKLAQEFLRQIEDRQRARKA